MPAKSGRPTGLRMDALLSSRKVFPLLLAFCLFVPLFFHGPRFGLPHIKGGDEPHYLTMINSLLMDGDLNLTNNYEAARKGSWQAGKKFAGVALDPHLVWNVSGRQVTWSQVYEDPKQWQKGADGYFVPEKREGVTLDVSGLPAYSSHPAGIVFLLAPLLWPFRGTPYTEPLALLCSNLAVILSAFLFRRLLGRYTQDPLALNLAALLAFLGTPLWAYGRTLFMEPFLLLFAVASYGLVLEKRSGFWPGVLLGLGALLKPNFLILLLPVTGFLALERQWKAFFLSLVGPCLATALILYTNAQWYGSPFTPPQPFWFGNPLLGMSGLGLSWNHGILTLAPVALPAIACWGKFLQKHRTEAWVIASAFGLYFLMMSLYGCWWGGWCYGPRLVGPVLAFLMAPLFYLPEAYASWGKPLKVLAVVLCLASLAFNALGAMDGYWDSHPLTILWGNLS